MKRYRTSIWRAERGGVKFVIFLPLVLGLLAFGFPPPVRYNILLGMLVLLVLFILLKAVHCFYVITDGEKLYVRNRIYLFWRGTYAYQEIREAKFNYQSGGYGVAHVISLQLCTPEGESWRYVINLVSDEDVLRLIEELKSHGVKVSTTQAFADYYAAIERRKHEKTQGEALRCKAKAYEEQMRQERERMKRNLIK